MSASYNIRQHLIEIARRDVGKLEDSENTAAWIAKLWPATEYPEGMKNREPYCAAGQCYCLREWLQFPFVLDALKMTAAQAEKWRCKSAAAFGWLEWARDKKVLILPAKTVLHAGDHVIYTYSHIELVTDDDGTETGPFTALGFNTNSQGARNGEGCFEKPRQRNKVKAFLRILP